MTVSYSGIAGARGCKATAIVIHNDGGSQGATADFYKRWLEKHDPTLGYAHYYVASDGVYQAELEKNCAWHCGNAHGNKHYIGLEVCQSLGDEAVFRANEQATFKLAAEICKREGLQPQYAIFPLHKELSSTSCPARSWHLHGKSIQAVRSYYVEQVMKYYGGNPIPPKPTIKKGVTTMQCLYQRPINSKTGALEWNGDHWATFFCNGVNTRRVYHPDEAHILKEVYRKNNGREIPEYTQAQWNKNAPWYNRLEAMFPVVK